MQINNWIKVDGEIVQVKAILEGKFIVKGKGDQKIAGTWEPVKLTSQIIDRFDISTADINEEFEKQKLGDEWAVVFNKNGMAIFYIWHLHDLQNFYKLWTGQELNTKQ